MGNQAGCGGEGGRHRDIRPFVYHFFVNQHMGEIIKKSCLIFPEQDQIAKTNLRMFKFDN